MNVIKFDPFAGFPATSPRFVNLDEAIGRLFSAPQSESPWTPAVDVAENENSLILKADLPGVEQNDIAINLENGTLTLKGERKFEKTEDKEGYHRIERGYGAFARSFTLPDSVDAEHVKADFKNGVLTVTLPKKELAKPRAIKVQVQ